MTTPNMTDPNHPDTESDEHPPPLDPPAVEESDPIPPPSPRLLRRAPNTSGAGVAAGLAYYFNLDPNLVRVFFVVSTFLGGFGLFAYLAGWILLPDARHRDPRPVVLNGSALAIISGAALAAIALSSLFGMGGYGPGAGGIIGPALIVGLGFYLLSQRPSGAIGTVGFAPSTPPTPPAPGGSTPWGTVRLETSHEPGPAEPRAPITAVTVAAAAVAIGALLMLDRFTGLNVDATAVFGTAVAVIGCGLLASAFLGRARGLYPLGLIALIGLGSAAAIGPLPTGKVGDFSYVVNAADELDEHYNQRAGELTLDLRGLDPSTIEGRELATEVDLGAGLVTVEVPAGLIIELDTHMSVGSITGPDGRETDGVIIDDGSTERYTAQSAEGDPVLKLDIDVRFGEIVINQEESK